MVYKCEVCGKDKNSYPNLSFHRFPGDDEKRRIWASLLGWSSICPKKLIFICSDHFDSNDLVTRAHGKVYLKRDANPLPQHSLFESSNLSDHSSRTESSPNEQESQEKEMLISSYNADENKPDENKSDENKPDENKPDQTNSSSTLTASECENEESKLEFIEPTTHNMPTRKR
ncbi:uncharacterized protein LOC123308097 [Coccinella septempunctata]|uniref:uncharacterized protein LOC123308097 n=1 Tax=Coccinella septempunctata TaxID=41139 RepID=UPI001D08B357|nr:uncharacterized protein LOC123308097 [Coccinella septempunctata]